MEKQKIIQVWVPGLSFSGGIQAFSKDFLRALTEGTGGVRKIVLSKNDLPGETPNTPDVVYRSFGHLPEPLRKIAFAFGLVLYAIRYRPSLIVVGHAHFARIAALLKRFLGIPFWVIAYGLEVWDERGDEVANSLRSADRILSISSFTRDKLIEQQKLNPKQFVILPTTFDETRFSPQPKPDALLKKLNLQPDSRVILTVCRLAGAERYKGYDLIVHALPAVLKSIPTAHYVLVGKGGDEGRVREMVNELELQEHVTLAGFVSEDELADYYNLCDVFAMPSKREGFGIVFLEALACGKPVLAGNADGSVDALCHGELGALINPDDVDEIVRSLVDILQGNYPLPIIYQPEQLRQKVIDIYGFKRFAATLMGYLNE